MLSFLCACITIIIHTRILYTLEHIYYFGQLNFNSNVFNEFAVFILNISGESNFKSSDILMVFGEPKLILNRA